MKKLWLLLALLLPLGACEPEDFSWFEAIDNETFEFVPLFKDKNRSNLTLKLHMVEPAAEGWDISQAGKIAPDFDKLRIITLYRKDCPACQVQAPYLAKLAQEFQAYPEVEFSVIFTDLHSTDSKEDLDEFKKQEWVQQLDNSVRTYVGPYLPCVKDPTQQENYCRNAFEGSWWFLETPFTVFLVKEKDATDLFVPEAKAHYRNWPRSAAASEKTISEAYETLYQMVSDFVEAYSDAYGFQYP